MVSVHEIQWKNCVRIFHFYLYISQLTPNLDSYQTLPKQVLNHSSLEGAPLQPFLQQYRSSLLVGYDINGCWLLALSQQKSNEKNLVASQ